MANTPVTGPGPVEFTDSSGKQIFIPLSAFSFNAMNTLVPDDPWMTVATSEPASSLLAYALKEGILAPAALPSRLPAMTVTATDKGASGNNISIAIAIPTPISSDPTLVQMNITVTETDIYHGLTAATIEAVIGSDTLTGSSPGLVQVIHSTIVSHGVPDPVTTAALAGTPPTLVVEGGMSAAAVFTLFGKHDVADATFTTVSITTDSTTPATFSLTAVWTNMVSGVTLADIEAGTVAGLGYKIQFSVPASGSYLVPAEATTTLSGGAAGQSATATLFAS